MTKVVVYNYPHNLPGSVYETIDSRVSLELKRVKLEQGQSVWYGDGLAIKCSDWTEIEIVPVHIGSLREQLLGLLGSIGRLSNSEVSR